MISQLHRFNGCHEKPVFEPVGLPCWTPWAEAVAHWLNVLEPTRCSIVVPVL